MSEEIELRWEVDPERGCWNVTSHKQSSNGYVPLRRGGRRCSAHRWAWEHCRGPIPPRMQVCHHCDNRQCMNPEHLFLGTSAGNMGDKVKKDRGIRGKRHWGAKLSDEKARFILRSEDVRASKLARLLEVSVGTVLAVRRRSSWKHVTEIDT